MTKRIATTWLHRLFPPRDTITPELAVTLIEDGTRLPVDSRDVGAVMACAQRQGRLPWVAVEPDGDTTTIRACPPRSRYDPQKPSPA